MAREAGKGKSEAPRRAAQVETIGAFEQLVLLAVVRLDDAAYGMTVRREIDRETWRPVSLGAVYSTLERLEGKRYVRSYLAPGGDERHGRARRLVRIEPAGLLALGQSLEALDRMRAGAPVLRPARAEGAR